jgi:predicted HD phosphohydrolase
METTTPANTSNPLQIILVKNPFIHTHKLVYNEEYSKISNKWEQLGLDIPNDELVPKYNKVPYSLNCYMMFNFFKDTEFPEMTFIEFEQYEHLLEVSYEEVKNKIIDLYTLEDEGQK